MPATATTATVNSAPQLDEALARDARIIERFTKKANGSVAFDAEAAVRAGARPSTVKDFASGLARARALTTAQREQALRTLAACLGESRYIQHWWGQELRLNSCQANGLIAVLSGGAGVATLAAAIVSLSGAIPVSAALVIAAAMIGIGVAGLLWCHREGAGMKVFRTWNGAYWCTTQ